MTALAIIVVALILAVLWTRSRNRAFENRSNVFNPGDPILSLIGYVVIAVGAVVALIFLT